MSYNPNFLEGVYVGDFVEERYRGVRGKLGV